MNHKKLLENEDQFIVSYELLYMLQWLMTYEKEAFTHLVHRAFMQGAQFCSEHDAQDPQEQFEQTEDLQHSVIDFFSFLEEEIQNASQAESIKNIMHTNLVKTLDHMDPKLFDPAVIQASMMATAEKLHPQRNHQAKEVFLKQLLKKWTPKKDKNKRHSLH